MSRLRCFRRVRRPVVSVGVPNHGVYDVEDRGQGLGDTMRGRGSATRCDRVRVRLGGCVALSTTLLLLLVASSCGDDGYSGPIPGVVATDCRFDVPEGLGTEGADYECGDLMVYEDRDAASGRTVKVHYLRFFSPASSTNATVYLEGGPGYNGNKMLSGINRLGPEFLSGLLVDGDFLSLAQRGTNLSEPALMSMNWRGMSEFADLPSYNTAYIADDVDDLRSTLGYDQLNIYGISYGSRLGLEVMRRHGDHLRSSVIGGLVPPQGNTWASDPKTFYDAITALNASCADAGACGSTYGDLVAKLLAGMDSLDDAPLTFHEGLADEVTLDGADFAWLLFAVMYDNASYPRLPLVISDVAERRTDRVGETVVAWIEWRATYFDESDFAAGMFWSVTCGEWFNPPDESAFDEINAEVPASLRVALGGGWANYRNSCASWPVGDPRPELSQPVTSAVRTLVSSGTMDPVTPPSYGDLVASTLSNREVVVFPASGHGATLQTPCGNQTVLAFLADPDPPLDTSCTESMAVDFELPSTMVPWSAADQARLVSELRYAPIPPPIRERLASIRRHR